MSITLPFDIIAQIIDTVGENEDTNLLKELALVSQRFHQTCSKHLFATVKLHDADPEGASKKGFVKLLQSRPEIVMYIRKLTYIMGYTYDPTDIKNDDLLSPILPNFLLTIPHLNSLTINALGMNWNEINISLTSAFLHLMHLPTINHIDLSYIRNFPLSKFTPSVNLHRLDICKLSCTDSLEEDIVVQSEMTPKICEFHAEDSSLVTTKLLHAKRRDGQPAFDFTDLKGLSTCLGNKQSIRFFLQNAKSLEKLHLSSIGDQNFEELHDILSASAGTLKVLELTLSLYEDDDGSVNLPLEDLCEELEAMAGHNILEALSFEVEVRRDETADDIGSMIQNLENVLVEPGWSALRRVSFKVPVACCLVQDSGWLSEDIESLLPDKYLNNLSNLESVTVDFSSYVFRC